jgi:hypothetical protein
VVRRSAVGVPRRLDGDVVGGALFRLIEGVVEAFAALERVVPILVAELASDSRLAVAAAALMSTLVTTTASALSALAATTAAAAAASVAAAAAP